MRAGQCSCETVHRDTTTTHARLDDAEVEHVDDLRVIFQDVSRVLQIDVQT